VVGVEAAGALTAHDERRLVVEQRFEPRLDAVVAAQRRRPHVVVAEVLHRRGGVREHRLVDVVEARDEPVLGAALEERLLRRGRVGVDGVGGEVGHQVERLHPHVPRLVGQEVRQRERRPALPHRLAHHRAVVAKGAADQLAQQTQRVLLVGPLLGVEHLEQCRHRVNG